MIFRRWFAFLVTFAFVTVVQACAPRPAVAATAPDQAHARAALLEMSFAVHATAQDCSTTARWLATQPGASARADALVEACVNGLLPPRDALYFATRDADPWKPEAGDEIACAGKAVAYALERIRNAIADTGVKPSSTMLDGLAIAFEIGERASRRCDPLHPTTSVTLTIDPRVPNVEPIPPGW